MQRALILSAGGLLAIVATILVFSEAGQAQAPVLSDNSITEGESIQITVTPGAGQSVATDQLEVRTPYDCRYRANYTSANLANGVYTFTYPAGYFNPTTDTRASGACYTYANTFISGSNSGADKYDVRSRVSLGAGSPNATFWVSLAMEARVPSVWQRTDEVTFISKGHLANINVSFQLDAPSQKSYRAAVVTTNGQGEARYTHRFDPGWNDINNPNADLSPNGWVAHFIDYTTRGKAGDDAQRLGLRNTTINIQWVDQPDPVVPRTNFTNTYARITYDSSIAGQVERRVTADDFRGLGNRISVDVVINSGSVADCGSTQVLRGGDTASYIVESTSPHFGLWRMDFRSLPNDPAGNYRFFIASTSDAFNNRFAPCTGPGSNPASRLSDPFQLVTSDIRPTFLCRRTEVRRAETDAGFDCDIELRYSSGALVNKNELPTALRVAIWQGTTKHETKIFEPQDTGAGTKFGLTGVIGILPANAPLGTITLRVDGPAFDRSQNRLVTTVDSPAMLVTPTKLRIDPTFHNATQPNEAFNRGEEIKVVTRIAYPDNTIVNNEDVYPGQGTASRGVAVVRFQPPDGTIRTFQLRFNQDPQRFQNQWIANYTTQAGDPVGVWKVVITVRDQYDNQNTIERNIRVGLVIQATPSTNQPRLQSNLTISATMTRPGFTSPEPGSLNITITGGGQSWPTANMVPNPQGVYQYVFPILSSYPVGTYTAVIRGKGTSDFGMEVITFDVQSTNIQVVNSKLSSTALSRLDSVTLTFTLQYANGAKLTKSEINSPTVRVFTPNKRATNLPVTYNTNTAEWSATYRTALNSLVGEYYFNITGTDNTVGRNTVDEFRTRSFTVFPAQVLVKNLQANQIGYDRGEIVRITARAEYADGSPMTEADVEVDVLAGADVVGQVDLKYNEARSLHEGTYQIKLQDPLSTASSEWSLRVKSDSIEDASGNTGPPELVRSASGFAVRLSYLNVQPLELPASGLTIGKDEAKIRFVLQTRDGSRVNADVSSVRVLLKRGNTVVGNSTVSLDANGYTAVIPLSRELKAGDNYHFTIDGKDRNGNEIASYDTQNFSLQESSEDSPAAGLIASLAGLAAAGAWSSRRRRQA